MRVRESSVAKEHSVSPRDKLGCTVLGEVCLASVYISAWLSLGVKRRASWNEAWSEVECGGV